jgi:hypothetical protein
MATVRNPGENSGFRIEVDIRTEINLKRFGEIIPPLRDVISKIDPRVEKSDKFTAVKKEGVGLAKKTDLFVFKNESKFCNLSIKSGSGNSVHQENIFEFVTFLEKSGAPQEHIQALLFYHWGDGTTDGTGPVGERVDSAKIKKQHPEIIANLQTLFNEHKHGIVCRTLLGKVDGSEPDHLLYLENRRDQELQIASMDSVIDFHCNIPKSARDLKVGNLNFQNWNRCLSGQETYTNKTRNDVQFKWGNIHKDIEFIEYA